MRLLRTRALVSCLTGFLLLGPVPSLSAQIRKKGSGSDKGAPGLSQLLVRFHQEESLPPARRIATAARIAASRDPKALDFLLSQVLREKSPQVQSVLAGGIGRRVGDPRAAQALPSLWDALLPSSRLSLARALPRSLRGKVLSFVRGLFEKAGDKDPGLRALLVSPLAESLPEGEVLPFLRRAAERELRARVRPNPFLARALGEALARLGGREAQKVFVALAASRPVGSEAFFLEKAARFQDPESLDWWIQEGLSSKSPYLRLLSLRGLAGSRSPGALAALRKALSDRDPRIQREAARALGTSGDPKGARSLERMLRKGPMVNRLEALDALHRLRRKDPAWKKTLLKLLGSPYPAFRARALDLLADLGARDPFDRIRKGAVDRNWMVRSAFYGWAGKVRDPRAVPLLIERLGVETGRLKQEVEGALRRIAGLTFGFDLKRWRWWWSREKEGFTPPPPRKHVARKRRYGITYYGIPVVSHRVVFVLDVSGSMAARVGTGGRTRLDMAKEALIQALTRFSGDTRFNIIFFHTLVKAWEKKLTRATRANQKKAIRFVRSTRPMGATNLYGALKEAFRDREADTIYLLSDGSPTAGEIVDPGELAREVLSWNRVRRIVIHTISLGTPSPLLQKLARETGGQYVRR